MFWIKNKKVYPCKCQFCIIKVGYEGVYFSWTCYINVCQQHMKIFSEIREMLVVVKHSHVSEMSGSMRKQDFCLCVNKGADQLCSK